MHTAFTLTKDMFAVEIDGKPADRDALFNANRHERLAVVVTTPLGGVGASFLVQLGITAYYDADRKGRQLSPHYPDIYFFHAGGSFGEYSVMDAWPARKQLFLSGDGQELLASINSHAITHLLLPFDMDLGASLGFKEPNAALDRLERCFLYNPSGQVADGNISIRSTDPRPVEDVLAIINLPEAFPAMISDHPKPTDPAERLDTDIWVATVKARLGDIAQADRDKAAHYRADLDRLHAGAEVYREIPPSDGVARFGQVRQA